MTKSSSVIGEGQTHAIPPHFSFGDLNDPRAYPTQGQRTQLQSIVDDLRSGIIPDDGDRALLSLRVVEAIYQSAAETRLIWI